MLNHVRFELLKFRNLFWAFIGLFVVSFPFAGLFVRRMGFDYAFGLDVISAIWAVMLGPVMGLLFGSAAGQSQRSELETHWPLSPERRLAGAWLAGLIYCALMALLGSAAGAAFSPTLRDLWSGFAVLPLVGLFVTAQGLTLAFVLAYLLNNMAAGFLLSAALTVPIAGAVLWWEFMSGLHGAAVDFPSALVAALAFAGVVEAGRRLAPKVALSRRGWKPWAFAAAGLALGLAAAALASGRSKRRLETGGFFMTPWTSLKVMSPLLGSEAARLAGSGVLVRSEADELAWVTTEGERHKLVPGQAGHSWLREPAASYISSVEWDSRGLLTALRYAGDTTEVWQGRPPEPLAKRWTLPRYMHLAYVGGKIAVEQFDHRSKRPLYAVLPDDGKPLRFKPGRPDRGPGLIRAADGSRYDYLPRHKWRVMTPEGRELPLFDAARYGGEAEYLRTDGKSVWLIAKDKLIQASVPDGKPEREWRLPRTIVTGKYETPWAAAADGLFWHTGRRIVFIDWNGNKKSFYRAFIGS